MALEDITYTTAVSRVLIHIDSYLIGKKTMHQNELEEQNVEIEDVGTNMQEESAVGNVALERVVAGLQSGIDVSTYVRALPVKKTEDGCSLTYNRVFKCLKSEDLISQDLKAVKKYTAPAY